MAEHNDLFAAALDAVNAVHARSAGEKVKTAVLEPLEAESLNAECIEDDDLNLELSTSAFDRILDEAVEEAEQEELLGENEFTGVDISFSDEIDKAEADKADAPAAPEAVAEEKPAAPEMVAEPENPAEPEGIAKHAKPIAPVKTVKPVAPVKPLLALKPVMKPLENPARVAELEAQLKASLAELESAKEALQKANEENEQLRASQKQLNDKVVRLSADFDNYRKRVTRDQDQMKNQAEERIVTSFLGVMDNFERAIAHAKASSDFDQLLQGVELTSKLYLSTLAKHGCVPYDSMGEVCDPVYHDVLQRVVDESVPHNTVVQEHLKGYKMHDHVVRPALVVVAQHEEGEAV